VPRAGERSGARATPSGRSDHATACGALAVILLTEAAGVGSHRAWSQVPLRHSALSGPFQHVALEQRVTANSSHSLALARARETLGGAHATLAGSDSEGNQRARPSLNVPFPRKPPDLLMAESPPTGGLSAFNGPAVDPWCAAPLQPSSRRPAKLDAPPEAGGGSVVEPSSRTRRARKRCRNAPDHGRMSLSVAVKRSPDSSSSPSMCRRAGPVSVHRSRK
jgi:hypothetical protein